MFQFFEEDEIKSLLDLCIIGKKRDLKKWSKRNEIRSGDFAKFILFADRGLLPWRHRISHRQFVPGHLEITDRDLSAIGKLMNDRENVDAQKALAKVPAIFSERRLIVGHIFYNTDLTNWHLFYFDQRDRAGRKNHWAGGLHIHLINHLWPNRDAETIWRDFNTGNPDMNGAEHIRLTGRLNAPGAGRGAAQTA